MIDSRNRNGGSGPITCSSDDGENQLCNKINRTLNKDGDEKRPAHVFDHVGNADLGDERTSTPSLSSSVSTSMSYFQIHLPWESHNTNKSSNGKHKEESQFLDRGAGPSQSVLEPLRGGEKSEHTPLKVAGYPSLPLIPTFSSFTDRDAQRQYLEEKDANDKNHSFSSYFYKDSEDFEVTSLSESERSTNQEPDKDAPLYESLILAGGPSYIRFTPLPSTVAASPSPYDCGTSSRRHFRHPTMMSTTSISISPSNPMMVHLHNRDDPEGNVKGGGKGDFVQVMVTPPSPSPDYTHLPKISRAAIGDGLAYHND